MYVHIGKDFIIPTNEVIAILDLEKILESKKIEDIIKELKIEDSTINIEKNGKSIILVKEQQKVKAYISNISSTTLEKRIQKEII